MSYNPRVVVVSPVLIRAMERAHHRRRPRTLFNEIRQFFEGEGMGNEGNQMANNDFDRIMRENIQEIFVHYAGGILDIKIEKKEALPNKLTGTYESEVDHLVMATSRSGDQFLLHFEFQTSNDLTMLKRVKRYHGALYHKYGLPIHHFVIYLGQKKATMRTSLEEDEIFRGFHLIPIANQKLEGFLCAPNPEKVILGILSDFGSQEASECIQKIIDALQDTCEDDIQLMRHLKQLKILARLRKLDPEVHEKIKKMPIFLDIRDSHDYKEGIERGQIETIIQLVSSGATSIQKAAKALGISVEEMNQRIGELKKESGLK